MNELLQQQKAPDANSFQKSNSNQSAFCVKLNSPFLLFQDNRFWKYQDYRCVISQKINCSMCNCRLIACPLPSEARAIVYSLSHDERPSVVVQGTYLNLYFANGTTASRVTMTRSMLVGAKKFFARQSRIRKQGQTGNTLTGNACRDVCACHAVTSFLDNLAQVLHISDSSIRLVLEDD